MQSASTRRFVALPLVAALAIAAIVGVGVSLFAFASTQTSSSQNLSTTEEADIPAIIIRETGGPWVRPGDAPSTEMPVFGPGDGLVDPAAELGGPIVGGTTSDRADAISGRDETSSDAYVAGPHQVAGGNEGAVDDASSMEKDYIVSPRHGRTTK